MKHSNDRTEGLNSQLACRNSTSQPPRLQNFMKKLYLFLACVIATFQIHAQQFNLVVPFAPGGGIDNIARGLAKELSKAGTDIVVVNRPGGDGLVALNDILAKKTDSNQLFIYSIGSTAAASVLNNDFGEKFKNFKPVAAVASFNGLVVAHRRTGIKTFAQLVDRITTTPTNIAVTGGTQFSLLARTIFQNMPNANLVVYPTGDAALVTQLLGGHIDIAVVAENSPVMYDVVSNGTLAVLGSTSSTTVNGNRIPSFKELGVNALFLPYYTIYSLQSMPQSVIDELAQQISDATNASGFQEFLTNSRLHKIPKKDIKSILELQYSTIPQYQKLLQAK